MMSDPTVLIECNRCEISLEIGLTPLASGWDDRNVEGTLRKMGWFVDGDTHICPECLQKEEDARREQEG